jgi:hypothetical protein
LVRSDAIPMPRSTDKTTLPKVVMTGTITTDQIRPDKMHVRLHPLWDGIHDEGLDLEAIQIGESHDPNDRGHGLQLLQPTR